MRALRAVSDVARLRLLRLCTDQSTSVSELAAATADSEPNVSRQLKQLAVAGLLRRVRRGQRVEYLPLAESGFQQELLGLLLARLDDNEVGLREARVRLRAMEAAGRNPALLRAASHEWLQGSRLGRSLRITIEGDLRRDAEGARVLARTAHPELLQLLVEAAGSVTLRARDKHELVLLKAWAADESAEIAVRSTAELRQQGRFDVVVELPLAAELGDLAQFATLLGRCKSSLQDDGILCCAVPYELLEAAEVAPFVKLRQLLVEQSFDCLALMPVEAEGRHLLLFRARLRARRPVLESAASLSV